MTHLDRQWIEDHIPHRGGMCLLESVLDWDSSGARCSSTSHRSVHNPLRAYGRLGAACGIEYAAQCMAVHGALIASALGAAAPRGYLASVRGVKLHVDRLDDVEEALLASVERVAGDEHTVLYQFTLAAVDSSELQVAGAATSGAGRLLVTGRAAIAFDTGNAGLLQPSNGHT